MTKILVAVPFGLGIFIALALLPGYQGYAAALGSYGGMMLALVGWTPMPMIAKVRAGKAGSILASIKALPSKLPFLNRGKAEAAETDPDPVGLDDVDSMLADLAAAAEEEAPAPSAGLGDIVDAPANSEPDPVAAVSVVEPTPSRFPLFAKLLAIPMAFLAKIRPHREPAEEPVAADAEPAAPGLLARAMAFIRSLLAKVVSCELADDVDELNPVEPTLSKTLRERVAAIRALLHADLSVAGLKRSTIATATCLVAWARALGIEDLISAAGRVPAFALFAVIVVATLPLLLADLGATSARNWWLDRAKRDDDDIDGPSDDADLALLAQAA